MGKGLKINYKLLFCVFFIITQLNAQSKTYTKPELDSLMGEVLTKFRATEYYESLELIEVVKAYGKKTGDMRLLALSEDLLAGLYLDLYSIQRALDHESKALEYANMLENKDLALGMNANLAHIHVINNDFKKGDKYTKIAESLNNSDAYNTSFYLYETKLMSLYKQRLYDSLITVSNSALKNLELKFNVNVVAPEFLNGVGQEAMRERCKIVYDLYLAFGLFETGQKLNQANAILNKLKDKNLEEILWLSVRVYENYYRIYSYKTKYFIERSPTNKDSILHYKKFSEIYHNKVATFIKEGTSTNVDFLMDAFNHESEIERLELNSKITENKSNFTKKIIYLLAFLAILTLGFLLYFIKLNRKISKTNSMFNNANENLTKLLQTRDKFLAVVSHEIRTPLYALEQLIASNPVDNEEDIENQELMLANYALTNLAHSVDNSLQYSRLSYFQDSIATNRSPTNLNHILTELKSRFAPMLIVNDVKLEIVYQGPNHIFEIARSKLIIVLNNLIKNAIEKDEVNEVSLTVTETSISETESMLNFCVWDDAEVISSEALDYIKKAEIIIEDENCNKGIKMGLILSNRILALFDSKLEFLGTDEFNTVSFSLQLKVSEQPTIASSKKRVGKAKILYVDDNYINLLVTKKIIESIGYKCDTVESGHFALTKIIDNDYDLILMDINMPEMDGYETSINIQKINSSIPILAYTALSDDEVSEKCRAASMKEVLTKPLNAKDFKRVLARYV